MLFLEAVNANQKGCFGWAVERIVRGVQPEAEVHPGDCDHHYHTKDNHTHTDEIHNSIHEDVIGNDEFENVSGRDDGHDEPNANHSGSQERMLSMDNEETDHHPYKWSWWPSWRDLQRHFFYEIGFLACAIQLVSGSLFWLTKFTTLPGITEHISKPVLDGVNWAPQMIGCIGFIIASSLFMFETQQKWYLPAPNVLGWHVGFWKLFGCIAFLLSAAFGSLGQHGIQFAETQSSISTLWGSCLILLGSLVQWYESLDKYPIILEGNSRFSEWNENFIEESEERQAKGGD